MIYPTYRSNAVALTHITTGIRVICSEYRSQHKNKESAWKRLCSLLYANQKGITPNKDIIRTYRLPDNDIWPDDLMKYARDVRNKQ